jgi:hypothetical protein
MRRWFPARRAARGRAARGLPPSGAVGPAPGAERAPDEPRRATAAASLRLPHQPTAAPPPSDPSRDTRPLEPHRRLPRHPRPPLPATSPPPRSPRFPSRRLDGSPPRLSDTHLLVPHLPRPAFACRRPASGPLQLPAWAGPSRFTWQVEEGGVRRKAADPPSSKAQAGSRKRGRGRGGGLLRSGAKPIERNRWSETDGAKQPLRGSSVQSLRQPGTVDRTWRSHVVAVIHLRERQDLFGHFAQAPVDIGGT